MQNSIVYLNGLYTPLVNAKISILDRGFCYGDGLFETMRACKGKVFKLENHIERLFESLPLMYLDLPMTPEEVKGVVNETLARNKFKNALIRLTVTRGINSPYFQIDLETPPTFVVYVRSHEAMSQAVYRKGVRINLITAQGLDLPGIQRSLKTCNYLSNILVHEISRRKGGIEGIMVDPVTGITEGATSNLFIVKDGILKTPAINKYVLEGVTRKVVLEIAKDHKVPVEECMLQAEDVLNSDEVFITNSGIDIVPVVRVDNTYIGNKKPGILTSFLRDEFLKCVEDPH